MLLKLAAHHFDLLHGLLFFPFCLLDYVPRFGKVLEGRAERLPLLLPVALQVLKEFSVTLLDGLAPFGVSSASVSWITGVGGSGLGSGAKAQRLVKISLTFAIFIFTLVRHVYLHVLLLLLFTASTS